MWYIVVDVEFYFVEYLILGSFLYVLFCCAFGICLSLRGGVRYGCLLVSTGNLEIVYCLLTFKSDIRIKVTEL